MQKGITIKATAETINSQAQEEYEDENYAVAKCLWKKAGNANALNKLKKEGVKHTYSQHTPPQSPALQRQSSTPSPQRQSVPQQSYTHQQQSSSSSYSSSYSDTGRKSNLVRNIVIAAVAVIVLCTTVPKVKGLFDNKPFSATATAPQTTATVSLDSLNMRSAPSTSSDIIKTLKKGDTLTVTGNSENGWAPVEHSGDKGYISEDLISLSDG